MPIAYWILNYESYDPNYNPDDWKDNIVFRDNILNVTDNNIEPFIKSIQTDRINLEAINISEYNLIDIFLFYIDFDTKTFISYFDDIEIEVHLPDKEWTGRFDNPLNCLSQDLQKRIGR